MLFAVVCFVTVAHAQGTDTLENKIRTSLTAYYKSSPQEKYSFIQIKVFMQPGKPFGTKHTPRLMASHANLSKTLYVQLMDKTGNVLVKNKLQVKDGTSYGNIDLPANLASGWYQLTAFTAWMMNFGQEGFYHQKIYVRSLTDTSSTVQKSRAVAKYHITFFPEGGDPIEGALNNIAFKATDRQWQCR